MVYPTQQGPICPHGVNLNQQRCLQCRPFPFGANFDSNFGESSDGLLNQKLDAIYSKLEAIERMLKV